MVLFQPTARRCASGFGSCRFDERTSTRKSSKVHRGAKVFGWATEQLNVTGDLRAPEGWHPKNRRRALWTQGCEEVQVTICSSRFSFKRGCNYSCLGPLSVRFFTGACCSLTKSFKMLQKTFGLFGLADSLTGRTWVWKETQNHWHSVSHPHQVANHETTGLARVFFSSCAGSFLANACTFSDMYTFWHQQLWPVCHPSEFYCCHLNLWRNSAARLCHGRRLQCSLRWTAGKSDNPAIQVTGQMHRFLRFAEWRDMSSKVTKASVS